MSNEERDKAATHEFLAAATAARHHQNKVDVAVQIARQWYDERRVRVIFDVANSGVALALQDLAKARDRIVSSLIPLRPRI